MRELLDKVSQHFWIGVSDTQRDLVDRQVGEGIRVVSSNRTGTDQIGAQWLHVIFLVQPERRRVPARRGHSLVLWNAGESSILHT